MRKEVKASKKYWFVWQEELNHPCAFDAFLFNDPAHLALQPSQNRYSYYLIKKHDEVIHARCTFFIEDQVAYSPYKGSFGSIEFSEKVFFELLEEYWDYIEADLCSKGVKEIFIKNYPVCYNPPHAQMLSFLFSTKGFNIQSQELNFHIDVDEVEFERKVHISERNRINKGKKQGYIFKEEKEFDLKVFFDFNAVSKKRKNIPITMTYDDLEKTISTFPVDYNFFSLTINNELVSLILTVRVNRHILYTFYNAEDSSLLSNSPIVLLHQHLYNYAKNNNFQLIDIGIGSDKGKATSGLVRFKEKISKSDLKFLFNKKIKFPFYN